MKKIITTFIIFWFLMQPLSTLWEEDSSYSLKQKYELYKQRVENYCKVYKYNNKHSETIYTIDESKYYKNLEENSNTTPEEKWSSSFFPLWDIQNAKESYRKNLDWIYSCAILASNSRAIKIVKDKLIKHNSKLNSSIKRKLEAQLKKIQQKIKNMKWCKADSDKNSNLIKESILKQVTYETCKHRFYLEYLRERSEEVNNLIPKDTEDVAIKKVIEQRDDRLYAIDKEIYDINKAFPIAFQAYSDYENNAWIHILLQLLREDFNIFRDSLHQTLTPINQLPYKTTNAMKR